EGRVQQGVPVPAQILDQNAETHILRHQAKQFCTRRGGRQGTRESSQRKQCNKFSRSPQGSAALHRRRTRAPLRGAVKRTCNLQSAIDHPHYNPCFRSTGTGGISRRNRSTARRADVVRGSNPIDTVCRTSCREADGGGAGALAWCL